MRDVRIDSILITVHDGNEYALKHAVRLAKAMRARLKIVDVISDPPAYRRMAIPNYAELAGLVRNLKQERLRKLARRLTTQSLQVETEILEGETATEIIREVLRNRHQVVVVQAEQGAEGCRVGATGMRLLRRCPCSVWIVRPSRSRKHLRILAAVATEPGDTTHADLNADVLNVSDSLAASLKGELHVLHVWRVFGESILTSPRCGMNHEQMERYAGETRQQHADELNFLLEKCSADLPARCVHLLKGDVRTAIPEFCRAHKIDLLVLGTVGRVGISGLIIGNTGEAVANEVDCSLIAVKAGVARVAVHRRHRPASVSAGVSEHDEEGARPVVLTLGG
jgi:nucleotide-binding universal stress UspA family protein